MQCICIVLKKFWSQENSFTRNVRNFGKICVSKFRKLQNLGSNPG